MLYILHIKTHIAGCFWQYQCKNPTLLVCLSESYLIRLLLRHAQGTPHQKYIHNGYMHHCIMVAYLIAVILFTLTPF